LKSIDKTILSFADINYTYLDFIYYLDKTKLLKKCLENQSLIDKQFRNFTKKEIINFEKTQLSIKYPDFKALLKEYRDGILLFEISDQMIWSRAIKDTTGLKKFYNNNSDKWRWEDRIKAEFFYSESKKQIKRVYNLKKESYYF
jgi:peptidyl-prolyl cis-trans isomerase SurA